MDFWKQFPGKDVLMSSELPRLHHYPEVNAHLHTPYSFSAFDSIEHAFAMASREQVKAIGINDFYSMDGYGEWAENAVKSKIFPLFNIEFVGLSEEEQQQGILINDPNNPGRIYLSGKGLAYPAHLPEPYASRLTKVKAQANEQVRQMCEALNAHLKSVGSDIRFSFPEILEQYTEGVVRERHLAKALREAVYEKYESDENRSTAFKQIFNGQPVKSELSDHAALENEIRSKLLKAGGPAFIPEHPDQFLSLVQIRELILAAGGIPTYPLLADSVNGGYTEFEEDREKLLATLKRKGIWSVEFIPNRNSGSALEEYATFFSDHGFLVSMGSEHNSPALLPIKLFDKEKRGLSGILAKINFEGAAMIAGHQYLVANGAPGFLDAEGTPIPGSREVLIQLGTALIQTFNMSMHEAKRK